MEYIVGENASCKTAIIDAVRLLLREDEFGFSPISESDFYKSFDHKEPAASRIKLTAQLSNLTKDEEVAFLPWSDLNGNASLTLLVDNKEKNGRFKRQMWGGASRASAFEWELFERINCIYLPPLRDAEAKLKEGRGSRLARLLRNIEAKALKEAKETQTKHPLEGEFNVFNQSLTENKDGAIHKANALIKKRLVEAVGSVFGQDTQIQFSEVKFNKIAESLRLFFFPNVGGPKDNQPYRSLEENSLGFNNLLYLATVLAELIEAPDASGFLKVLLIEEPEAHLHPQLQTRLLKYLKEQAEQSDVEIIVTTHSPTLASSAPVDAITHLSMGSENPCAVAVRDTGLDVSCSRDFVDRWLDVTKSTLLFAKGVILVEGIAESFLVPTFAERVLKQHNAIVAPEDQLPKTLEDAGVSVINMNGIYFKHFMQLFCNLADGTEDKKNIPIRCAGITDLDPAKEETVIGDDGKETKSAIIPTPSNPSEGTNPALELLETVNATENCRLHHSPLKTLEYDLAFEGNNAKHMADVLEQIWPNEGQVKKKLKDISGVDWKGRGENDKGQVALEILNRVDGNTVGKGYPHFVGTIDSWLHNYLGHPFGHHVTGYRGLNDDRSLRLIDATSKASFLNAFKTKYGLAETGNPSANQYIHDWVNDKWIFRSGTQSVDQKRSAVVLENWQKTDLRETKAKFLKSGFATYADIEDICLTLLVDNANLRKLFAKRFPFIIVDECQDLSEVQLNILEALRSEGSCLHFVGDLNQAIYEFKEVDPAVVAEFAKKTSFVPRQLTKNFRSSQSVINVCQKLVPESIAIESGFDSTTDPACICVTYPREAIASLPEWFADFLLSKNLDTKRSKVVARGWTTVGRLRPTGKRHLEKHQLWLAEAIRLWNDGAKLSMPEAISLAGRFIAASYLNGIPTSSHNFYCPEGVNSAIDWRLFLSRTLDGCCKDAEISDLNKPWNSWAALIREKFPGIVKSAAAFADQFDPKINQAFDNPITFRSLQGKADESVTNSLQTGPSGPTRIPVTTIHDVKGQTFDAVMVVSALHKGGATKDGHWEYWLEDKNSEAARLAYVASSRPRHLLVWAVPEGNGGHDTALSELGFSIERLPAVEQDEAADDG